MSRALVLKVDGKTYKFGYTELTLTCTIKLSRMEKKLVGPLLVKAKTLEGFFLYN